MNGPFFDKAFQRRAYEEELKTKRVKLSRLGPNFGKEVEAPSKPAYRPRKSPKLTGDSFEPLNYTPEENAARKTWLKSAKSSRDAKPEGYKTGSHPTGTKGNLSW